MAARKKEPKIRVDLLDVNQQKEYKERKEREEKQKAEKNLNRLRAKQSVTSKVFKPIETLARPSPRIKQAKSRPSPRIKQAKFRVPITPQQRFFKTFIGGRKAFGTGQNLPHLNKALTSGYGLVKHPLQDETGRLFGF